MKNKKLTKRLILTHSILISYIIAITILYYTKIFEMKIDVFGWGVPLWGVLIITYVFELASTFTFQLRMKLTADYEINKKEKLINLIPLIAGLSWGIAGIQGIIFLTGNPIGEGIEGNELLAAVLKLTPVFIATYNGVYTTLIMKGKK